jgi:hypothetical protein
MTLSRRKFLGVAGGAVVAAGGVRILQTTIFDSDGESAAPEKARFLAAVGTTFTFRGNGSSLNLRLADVTDAPADPRAADLVGEAFSLAFEGPKASAVGQGTYAVRHGDLGRFPLFVSPSTQRGDTIAAVINRRVPKT